MLYITQYEMFISGPEDKTDRSFCKESDICLHPGVVAAKMLGPLHDVLKEYKREGEIEDFNVFFMNWMFLFAQKKDARGNIIKIDSSGYSEVNSNQIKRLDLKCVPSPDHPEEPQLILRVCVHLVDRKYT